jgi:hypothetical protein
VRRLFAVLAAKTRLGSDVVGYLDQVKSREERLRSRSKFAGALKYIHLEPRVPVLGVGVDLSALLHDLAAS